MENGIIYSFLSRTIELIKHLNLVEALKDLGENLGSTRGKTRQFRILMIDTYIILKWLTIVGLWWLDLNIIVEVTVAAYLLFFNLFTYFYHHVWTPKDSPDLISSRRRYLSYLQAFAFNLFAFSYLYSDPFVAQFRWIKDGHPTSPWLYSLSNSLTLSSSMATPEPPQV